MVYNKKLPFDKNAVPFQSDILKAVLLLVPKLHLQSSH